MRDSEKTKLSSWMEHSYVQEVILKRERCYGRRFSSKRKLVRMIDSCICCYNARRVQRNPGILTPVEKHKLCLAA